MAKRKLNKRQQWRIEKIQKERTERLNRKEKAVEAQAEAGELGPEQEGLVIAHYGQQLDIEALEGDDTGRVFRCFVRANIDNLVTGDRVVWRPGKSETGVIVARCERNNLLQRPDNFGALKPVAANIDHIILVIAPEPEPHNNLIDRYLVASESSDIPAVILLNKTDLITDQNRAQIDALLGRYEALGYQVERTSATACAGQPAPEVEALVRDQTSVFVGQSGVGKSSIIQTLLPDELLRVGAVSESTGKGVHTTTTAKLFHLPGGGDLIDSPGIREFGLWHMTPQEVEYGFREIRPLIGLCKFRNCRHMGDPGCALDAAAEAGTVSKERLQSFHRILQDMAEQQARGLRIT
ncbi:MAG: small ribosomal subunit biogenesis GTPase RsgA [Marinobacter sp.]|uniref:small ribosomal subunit biogenesis GTPase RsgA n=1 Tax=Marinobacter sp. TaxID=50741 RepID=UPI0029C23881|nr:small ribosomal subunit biogenesis GTPase RsgA [Marinobacter sp.]MDX5335327.1 small ribosomal subunit biogenesis GTPase RsgA [Marinobacter sp.]MDX5386123.1 small ribosomal subunit biogenesis GTPase RsgA [Marinobacter sp.]MDX5440402.1 small ribosomal subunit biogenesis GTPase RsgA [Alteromonadaceae bacterium]MDX5471631.1 small ribosomal subunit biogenesis GTPase RsgA [Marinobacter sp.]